MSEKSTGSSLEISRQLSAAAREGEQLSAAFRTITQSVNMCADGLQVMQTVTEGALDMSRFKECNVALSEMEREQESLNTAIEGSAAAADGLLKKIGGVITKFASWDNLEKIAGLSDSVMQTTAKLDMMNDGFRTTQELQDMVYAAAQNSRSSYSQMASDIIGLGNIAKDSFANNDEIVAFAELVNKQFAIAGISGQDASDAFAQLSQAMGEGALSGAQLEEIFSAAPNLIQSIADYMGVPIEKIGEMAASGEITSQAIKNAMFSASDEINGKFAQLPMTFEQIGNSLANTAQKVFEPMLVKVNEIANSEEFNSFIDGAINALYLLGDVSGMIFDGMAAAGSFIYDNLNVLIPLILGLAAVVGIYMLATHAAAIAQAAAAAATNAWTAAQGILNTILGLNPVILIVMGIIALIAVIYMVVGAINNLVGTSYSATGIICGAVAAAGAFIMNLIIGVLNGLYTFFAFLANAVIGIVEWILNVFGGGFNSFGDACANLIGNIISWFLSLGKVVTTIIDAIFGTDWTSGLNAMQDKVLSWGKNENSITLDRFEGELDRVDYGDAFDSGYKFGEGIDKKVSDMFNQSKDAADGAGGLTTEVTDTLGSVSDNIGTVSENTSLSADNTASAADSTGSIADSMEITQEDLKYLRDIAEREVIDRTTFKDISVNLGGISNIVNSMSDLDGIADYLGNVICEQMLVSAEGI